MFTLTLSAEQLNVILAHLDQGPHGKVRPLVDEVIRQVNAQQQAREAAAQGVDIVETAGLTD